MARPPQRALELAERRRLSALSDEMARQMAATLSREAGLYTAHEMMESLDPNFSSELGIALMAECERLLDEGRIFGAVKCRRFAPFGC